MGDAFRFSHQISTTSPPRERGEKSYPTSVTSLYQTPKLPASSFSAPPLQRAGRYTLPVTPACLFLSPSCFLAGHHSSFAISLSLASSAHCCCSNLNQVSALFSDTLLLRRHHSSPCPSNPSAQTVFLVQPSLPPHPAASDTSTEPTDSRLFFAPSDVCSCDRRKKTINGFERTPFTAARRARLFEFLTLFEGRGLRKKETHRKR